jgi:hypothetical protein
MNDAATAIVAALAIRPARLSMQASYQSLRLDIPQKLRLT